MAAANSNGKMKKHEACYWLNRLIEEEQRSISYERENMEATTVKYGDDAGKPLSDETIEYNRKRGFERIAEAEQKIAALDIAASSLTN